jgi:hypothetical protein
MFLLKWSLTWGSNEIDVDEHAVRAVADPAAVASLRDWFTQMGIPADYRPPMPANG